MSRNSSVLLVSFLLASPALAASAPKESWGKAGVSLAQYRQDALDCGKQGYYTDISKTDDAKAFVKASRQLDAVTTGVIASTMTEGGEDLTNPIMDQVNQQQHIVDSVHADERFHHIKQTLEDVVGKCLAGLGYSKFRLTDDQRRKMSHLGAGSDARHDYLYSLASDPAVLQAQAENSQP